MRLVVLMRPTSNRSRPLAIVKRLNYSQTRPSRSITTHQTTVDDEALFNYTAGRWLWNEQEQLLKRRRTFNVHELARRGAASVDSQQCIGIEKLVEGNFNKVFLLRMDNGKEAIARLPNPNAGRPHLSTASEVATMDYVRDVLNIPVPRVLDWSSQASATPVEAEYVIMEKAAGRPLSEHWDSMKNKERAAIARQLAAFDSRMAEAPLPSHGSLYYADEKTLAHHSTSAVVAGRFVVGPSTSRVLFDGHRGRSEPDFGPWHTAETYFTAVIDREQATIEMFGTTGRPRGICNAPGLYNPTTTTKLSTLSQCRLILPSLLSRKMLNTTPTLRHPDLHTDNIFVDPTSPTTITSVIDWQSTHSKPIFEQIARPSLLDRSHPTSNRLSLPKLPPNPSPAAKQAHAAQTIAKLWTIRLCRTSATAYRALRSQNTLTAQILAAMGRIFDDYDPVLQQYLVFLCDNWEAVTHCPLHTNPLGFSEEERRRREEDMLAWERGLELMQEVVERLGVYIGWEGQVDESEYEGMKRRLDEVKEEFLQGTTGEERRRWEEVWPFGSPPPRSTATHVK